MRSETLLDLAKLDSDPVDLYLVIYAAAKVELAVGKPADQIAQNRIRWQLNKGLIGRLRLIVLLLLRLRAFAILHALSQAIMWLPWRLAPEFHSMLVTQLQREASRGLAPQTSADLRCIVPIRGRVWNHGGRLWLGYGLRAVDGHSYWRGPPFDAVYAVLRDIAG